MRFAPCTKLALCLTSEQPRALQGVHCASKDAPCQPGVFPDPWIGVNFCCYGQFCGYRFSPRNLYDNAEPKSAVFLGITKRKCGCSVKSSKRSALQVTLLTPNCIKVRDVRPIITSASRSFWFSPPYSGFHIPWKLWRFSPVFFAYRFEASKV